MKLNCSNPSAHMPMMKPNRQKVIAVRNRKATIAPGCSIRTSTKKVDVIRMIAPITIDFVAAAPT